LYSNRVPQEAYETDLQEHFQRFLAPALLHGRRKILVIDTVSQGTTLRLAHRRITAYAEQHLPGVSVEALGIFMDCTAPEHAVCLPMLHIHRRQDNDLRSHLIMRTYQHYAEHTRFEPGVTRPDAVAPNPRYSRFHEIMRGLMGEGGCGESLGELGP
jgi:hypothetical protein